MDAEETKRYQAIGLLLVGIGVAVPGVVISAILIMAMIAPPPATSAATEAPAYEPIDYAPDTYEPIVYVEPVITKYEYDLIRAGMTYRDVCAIIGEPGEEVTSVGVGRDRASNWMWANDDGSNAVITFGGGRVASKCQIWLK